MERRLVPGTAVEFAGKAWRIERTLGADAALLRGADGMLLNADPAAFGFPEQHSNAPARPVPDEARATPADWAEACRRRDLLSALAAQLAKPISLRRGIQPMSASLGSGVITTAR